MGTYILMRLVIKEQGDEEELVATDKCGLQGISLRTIRSRTLAQMSATLALGKQCVTALINHIPRVMESSIIIVVGGKRNG